MFAIKFSLLGGDGGSDDECGPNEVYMTCGTACPEKCSDTGPVYCPKKCVIGCFCKTGYKLQGDKCVHQSQCKKG